MCISSSCSYEPSTRPAAGSLLTRDSEFQVARPLFTLGECFFMKNNGVDAPTSTGGTRPSGVGAAPSSKQRRNSLMRVVLCSETASPHERLPPYFFRGSTPPSGRSSLSQRGNVNRERSTGGSQTRIFSALSTIFGARLRHVVVEHEARIIHSPSQREHPCQERNAQVLRQVVHVSCAHWCTANEDTHVSHDKDVVAHGPRLTAPFLWGANHQAEWRFIRFERRRCSFRHDRNAAETTTDSVSDRQ